MEIIYEDHIQKILSDKQPQRYRVVLSLYKNVFKIKREYFRCGFHDGEKDDKIFLPDTKHGTSISYISIMTQRVDDKEYLYSLEKLLIDKYIEECERLIPQIQENLEKTIIMENKKIEEFNNSLIFLSTHQRKEKIEKIKEKICGQSVKV